jgi:hypothetical protein
MDTVTQQIPQIGAPYEGGYFGGILLINGIRHAIAWAPKLSEIRSEILDCATRVIEGASNFSDSVANTKALLEAGSPAAKLVGALVINGCTDWAIPARDALELGYRYFKPTGRQNYCSFRDGENPSSWPPGFLYSPDMPSQTALDPFKDGGAEAFDADWYWSSTIDPRGYAFCQTFYGGGQNGYDLSYDYLVRAVRQIRLDP